MPVATHGGSTLDQRHGLALHVRTHQGAVRVVVLEERDQRCGDTDELLGRDIDIVDFFGLELGELAVGPCEHEAGLELTVAVEHVRGREHRADFFICAEIDDLLGNFAVLDHAVWGAEEAVLVDGGVDAE